MKNFILTFISVLYFINLSAQSNISKEIEQNKKEQLEWWTNDRFGMFIHWGLYSQPARHEWVKRNEKMTDEQYHKYFEVFNPDLFNPTEWAKIAKAAGMKYAVITTKHHEGFCMFDSKYTDYKVTNTPYGKDIIKMWVDAFRAEGLKIGFYYSLIDWHHPDYIIDKNHPQGKCSDKEYAELNKSRDMEKYREYLKNQVSEILSNYGTIDILWLDYSFPGKHGKGYEDWDSKGLLKIVRELQPNIIINDRLDLKDVDGGWDFTTPEQFKISKWPTYNGEKIPWETCQTFSGSWGYYRDEMSWKDTKQLLALLIESVSKGGNLLLNVGPTARGYFDDRAISELSNMGNWLKYNARSIYGCTQAPSEYKCPSNCLMTYNKELNRLYIHLLDYPIQNFVLPEFKGKVKYAQFLHDASEIKITEPHGDWMKQKLGEKDLNLSLPVVKPNVEIPVIELFLNK